MQTLDYEVYRCPTTSAMPNLIADERVPASVAQVMRGRLEGDLLLSRYHNTGDAVIYYPDGSAKLVWDSRDLRGLCEESLLSNGALVLSDRRTRRAIDGPILTREEMAAYTCYHQSKSAVLESPVWRWLAREDLDLLYAYANVIFSRVKERYDLDEAMAVFAGDYPQSHVPVLRSWRLGYIGDFGGRSEAFGYHRLDKDDGDYLVGVRQPKERF